MPPKQDHNQSESILNHPRILFLPPILRPPALLLAVGGLYALLVFPLAITLLGVDEATTGDTPGVSIAILAGICSFCFTWLVLRTVREATPSQRLILCLIISVLCGLISISLVWASRRNGFSRDVMTSAGWASCLLLMSSTISGFSCGLAGIVPESAKGFLAFLYTGIPSKLFLPITCALLILVGKPIDTTNQPVWKIALVALVVIASTHVLIPIGWLVGRRLRSFLASIPFLGAALQKLGPPLGLFAFGYAFLGALFGTFHAAIWKLDHSAYVFPPNHSATGLSDFLYFSFITLATVGYGDIAPVSNAARACTVVEIVIGQFWVLVVLAIVLSRLSESVNAAKSTHVAESCHRDRP